MAAKNDITGDSIQTRGISDAYRDNYDLIFGKKKSKINNEEVKNEEGNSTEATIAGSDDSSLH